ncbi:MAG: endonuclease/exonuclease/phosphatase family protein, partial [Pseudomonadota bacterium]
ESRYPYNVLIDCITDPRGIDVGIYSKHPLGNVRTNIFTTDTEGKRIFSRDCLEVEVLTPAGPVHVLANHLKSKSRGGDDRRKAQANEIKSILGTRYNLATDKVIVLGDLNDTPASDPLSPLLSMPALTDALELEGLPDAARWSYVYEGRAQQIDYILISDGLRGSFRSAGLERRGMPPEYLAGQTPTVSAFPTIDNWRNAGSDHAAIFADFEI